MSGKHKRPDDMPGRVCRALEGFTLLEMKSKEPLEEMVYRFTHIASGLCGNPHDDWVADFIVFEAAVEVATTATEGPQAEVSAHTERIVNNVGRN